MTRQTRFYGLVAAVLLSAVITFGSVVLDPWQLAMAATVVGVLVAYASLALLVRDHQEMLTRLGFERNDERSKRIEKLSARNALIVVYMITSLVVVSATYRPWDISGNLLSGVIALVAGLVYLGSVTTYKSNM